MFPVDDVKACVLYIDRVGPGDKVIPGSAQQRTAAHSSAQQRTAAHSSAQQRTAAAELSFFQNGNKRETKRRG